MYTLCACVCVRAWTYVPSIMEYVDLEYPLTRGCAHAIRHIHQVFVCFAVLQINSDKFPRCDTKNAVSLSKCDLKLSHGRR